MSQVRSLLGESGLPASRLSNNTIGQCGGLMSRKSEFEPRLEKQETTCKNQGGVFGLIAQLDSALAF